MEWQLDYLRFDVKNQLHFWTRVAVYSRWQWSLFQCSTFQRSTTIHELQWNRHQRLQLLCIYPYCAAHHLKYLHTWCGFVAIKPFLFFHTSVECWTFTARLSFYPSLNRSPRFHSHLLVISRLVSFKHLQSQSQSSSCSASTSLYSMAPFITCSSVILYQFGINSAMATMIVNKLKRQLNMAPSFECLPGPCWLCFLQGCSSTAHPSTACWSGEGIFCSIWSSKVGHCNVLGVSPDKIAIISTKSFNDWVVCSRSINWVNISHLLLI